MQDPRNGPDERVRVGGRPADPGRTLLSGWTADDDIPALTRRVAYLEGRLVSTQADLDAARRRIAAYAEAGRSLDATGAEGYRGADEIRRQAQAEADEILRAAVDERRMLMDEVRRLRTEREALGTEPESPPAIDSGTAVVQEMRSLLLELVRGTQAGNAAGPASRPDEDVQEMGA